MSLLTPLAESGNASAQFLVGDMYAKGNGVDIDIQTAMDWTQKAALSGMKEAQYTLGMAHIAGSGVTQDYTKAYEWVKKSAGPKLCQGRVPTWPHAR